MSANPLFQDFGTLKVAKSKLQPMSQDDIEELKLQAFENGYKAGWDDSAAAQAQSTNHLSTELSSNLQSISFEYHELRATLKSSVQTIVSKVTQTVLPSIAQASLGTHICELVASTVRDSLERRIEIAVSPARADAVRSFLSANLTAPFELISNSELSPNQATLQLGEIEKEINLDRTMAEIEEAISVFFETA